MGFWRRLKRIWDMSEETVSFHAKPPASETAVFIMPDRVKELLSEKKDLTIDDLLDHA